MKLYRTDFIDDDAKDQAAQAIWSGTQSDAAGDRKRLKTDGMREIKTTDVDVPTSKQELLAWLNGYHMIFKG